MFVLTPRLKGGLNQIIFLLFSLFFFSFWLSLVCGGWYLSSWLWPLSFRAFWYIGFASLKLFSLLDIAESLLFMPIGICFIIDAGWFDPVLT